MFFFKDLNHIIQQLFLNGRLTDQKNFFAGYSLRLQTTSYDNPLPLAPAVNADYLRVVLVANNDDSLSFLPGAVNQLVNFVYKWTGGVDYSQPSLLRLIKKSFRFTVRTDDNDVSSLCVLCFFNHAHTSCRQVICNKTVVNQWSAGKNPLFLISFTVKGNLFLCFIDGLTYAEAKAGVFSPYDFCHIFLPVLLKIS